MFPCMLIVHKEHINTIHVYIVIIMTHVIALEARQSSQGSFEPIIPPQIDDWALVYPGSAHQYWRQGMGGGGT